MESTSVCVTSKINSRECAKRKSHQEKETIQSSRGFVVTNRIVFNSLEKRFNDPHKELLRAKSELILSWFYLCSC